MDYYDPGLVQFVSKKPKTTLRNLIVEGIRDIDSAFLTIMATKITKTQNFFAQWDVPKEGESYDNKEIYLNLSWLNYLI